MSLILFNPRIYIWMKTPTQHITKGSQEKDFINPIKKDGKQGKNAIRNKDIIIDKV